MFEIILSDEKKRKDFDKEDKGVEELNMFWMVMLFVLDFWFLWWGRNIKVENSNYIMVKFWWNCFYLFSYKDIIFLVI